MYQYRIHHRTTYTYDFPVSISHHVTHLKPLTHHNQTCKSFAINVTPKTEKIDTHIDFYDNAYQIFSLQERHKTLVIESNSVVEVHPIQLNLEHVQTTCDEVLKTVQNNLTRKDSEIIEYTFPTAMTPDFPEIQSFASSIFTPEKPYLTALLEMLDVFKDEFEFDPKATDIYTPISETLKNRKGVCQDFAHTMIAALRSQGFAARYVSGYILSHPPQGMKRLEGADASHAWVSVYLPQVGWIELDPTNRLICNHEHISVAYGRDYSDVSMIKGAVTGGGKHMITVQVTVAPIS